MLEKYELEIVSTTNTHVEPGKSAEGKIKDNDDSEVCIKSIDGLDHPKLGWISSNVDEGGMAFFKLFLE